MKICGGCGLEKSADGYHKCQAAKDGLQRQCKACRATYRADHKEHLADYYKSYWRSSKGKAVQAKGKKQQRLKYPEKEAAKQAVKYAVKTGKLKRSVYCEKCGLPSDTEGHHDDYSEQLSVQWLCRKCHFKIHNL